MTNTKYNVLGALVQGGPTSHPKSPHCPVLTVLLAEDGGVTFRQDVSLRSLDPATDRDEALDWVVSEAKRLCAHELDADKPTQLRIGKAVRKAVRESRKWEWRGAWDCVVGAFYKDSEKSPL